MLMTGSNIQSPADKLLKVQEEYLYHKLVSPKPEMVSAIQQLRIVYSIDSARYSQLKRSLPYVVCGMFNPPFRRTENFAYTENFILDFDHLTAKGLDAEALRTRICADSRVVMCFTSPSQDGLKVMFRLKERCYDSGLYTLFYKEFAARFAQQLELEQVLDSRTSDVTRACFVSVDSKAYFNPSAETVDIKAYVDTDNPLAAFDMKQKQASAEKKQAPADPDIPHQQDPTKDIMAQIRAKLNPGARVAKKEAYVPVQLDEIIQPICESIKMTGIEITDLQNIQYGKKIRARLGLRQAELNLFYGKRGYSVVESPRRGTDDELNKLLADIVRSFLADQSLLPY